MASDNSTTDKRGDPSGWDGACDYCGFEAKAVACPRCGLWSGREYPVVQISTDQETTKPHIHDISRAAINRLALEVTARVGPSMGWPTRACDELAAVLHAQADEIERLRAALEWYAEQARLCRLIHREGDAGRKALDADGGKRAREALGQ